MIRLQICAVVAAALWLAAGGSSSCAAPPESSADTFPASLSAAGAPPSSTESWVDESATLMRGLIERFTQDHALLERKYPLSYSESRFDRLAAHYREWLDLVEEVEFESLDHASRVDWVLFGHHLEYALRDLEHERKRVHEVLTLAPPLQTIIALEEQRRVMQLIEPRQSAMRLMEFVGQADALIEAIRDGASGMSAVDPSIANRAVRAARSLRGTLAEWFHYFDGYDPLFSWWVSEPYERAVAALSSLEETIHNQYVGPAGDDDSIIGDPIGRDALLDALAREMIPYSPEELIEIAEREYAWCLERMLAASRELGFGDDWKQALDHVKNLHVEPGDQPQLVRELALEAIDFLEERALITIPDLCKEAWRMEMMSPERQKIAPFFLGGETIIVAFPTDEMAHADKMMSLRGNNRHFARATVHHELIPGHHLQGFMTARFRPYRDLFGTPFWGEGWALYWEMRMWDLDFARGPEDEIGMLFWRMHRCARIVFSLRFHLGEMTAREAIEYLIDNVGHERNSATAEVRRSVSGDYGPLYQAAYLLGGLQFRALHNELVTSGKMSEREFHDAVLRLNSIPVAMVRASLRDEPIAREAPRWRFASD